MAKKSKLDEAKKNLLGEDSDVQMLDYDDDDY